MSILKKIFQRPVTICLIIVIAIIMGFVSTSSMAVNLLPNISFPYLGLVTTYVGADAETIDAQVTSKLETQISSISDIHELSTYSMDNASVIVLQFEYGTDIEKKTNELKEKIEQTSLPSECKHEITTVDLNSSAVSTLAMYSTSSSLEQVYNDAVNLKNELLGINGVGSVEIQGAPEKTLQITPINGLEMASLLIISEITTINSYDIPLGDVIVNGDTISLKNESGLKSIEDIKNLSIGLELPSSYLTTFQNVQEVIDYLGSMNSTDLANIKNDADGIVEFIDEIESKSNDELDDISNNLNTISSITSLVSNNSDATLKYMWTHYLKDEVESEDFQSLSEDDLKKIADDIGISYDLLKYLQENGAIDPETNTSNAELKWNIMVDFRANHPGEISDEQFCELFYMLEIASDQIDDENYISSDDLTNSISLARSINTVSLNDICETLKNGETVSNEQYAALFINSSEYEQNITFTPTMIGIIRSKYFNDNYKVFYDYKILHEEKQTIVDEQTGEEKIEVVGNEISSEDFMDLYNKMTFEEELAIKPTVQLLEFVRTSDFTDNKLTTTVGQIADVNVNYDFASYAMYNDITSLQVLVYGSANSNATQIVEDVEKAIGQFSNNDSDFKIVMLDNQANFINDSLSNALVSLIIGGILAVAIIYLFLRKIRSSLIIAISMPLSVLCTLICLYLMGITLNMVSIGGLAVGIGMLVDNSIVVLESISSERDKNKSALEASLSGVKLVLGSLIGSTLTSICVFFPILFMNGLTKEIFSDLAWAVIFSLSFSLIVAVIIIPTLYCLVYSKKGIKEKESGKVMDKLKKVYEKILTAILKKRWIVILTSTVLFISSIALVFTSKIEFLPSIDEKKIEVSISFDSADEYKQCEDSAIEAYNLISSSIDSIDYMSMNVSKSGLIATNYSSTITIQLESDANTANVSEQIRELLNDNYDKNASVAEIDGVVATLTGGMAGVSVNILGDDIQTLKEISEKIKQEVLTFEGIQKATDNMLDESISYTLLVDKEKCVKENIDYQNLIATLRVGLSGYDIGDMTLDDESIKVEVKWNENTIGNYYESIGDYVISYDSSSNPITLSDVSSITTHNGQHVIRKIDGKNVLIITLETYGIDTNTASNYLKKATKNALKEYEGYSFASSGVSYYLTDAFQGLIIALIIAFFLLFAIMACLFESLRKPLIVIFSFPFAFTGGFIALVLSNVSLNVVSFIGLIMLMGVIVNDAIVLIERFAQLEEAGYSRYDAIIKGSKQRLRAVLMTTLTTVLALIPMALGIGKGGALMQPLGVVAIGGLFIGTLVTLILIPTVYSLFMRVKKDNVVEAKDNTNIKKA